MLRWRKRKKSGLQATSIKQMEQLEILELERYHIEKLKNGTGVGNQSSVKIVATLFCCLSLILFCVGQMTISIIQGSICLIMSFELYEAAQFLQKYKLRFCGVFWFLHALG